MSCPREISPSPPNNTQIGSYSNLVLSPRQTPLSHHEHCFHDKLRLEAPYRYDESIEQQRWDEILEEVALRCMTVKDHDHLLQGRIPKVQPDNSEQRRWNDILEEVILRRMTSLEPEAIPPVSDNPVKQRRWDRNIYEQWLLSSTVKEHDRLIQGLIKVPAHIFRPNDFSIEREFTTVYAVEA